MKIVILSTYPPAHCGIGTYSSYLYSGLKKIRNTKTYILTEKSNPEISSKHLSVIPCYDPEKEYVNDFIQKIRQIKPDVVNIQHEFGLFGWDNRLLRLLSKIKSLGIPCVITLHTIYAKELTTKIPEKTHSIEDYYLKISKLAARIIVHQEECKSVLARMGINENKISVISHGTVISKVKKGKALRKKLGLKQDARIMMYFGFFKDVKLSLSFIEALPKIFKDVSKSYFYIIGSFRVKGKRDFVHMRKVKSLIKKFNIGKRVIMINKFVDEEDVPLYMASADVVVYPYDIEYWGDTGAAHRAIGAGAVLAVSRIPKFDEIRSEICEEMAVLPHKTEGWARVITRILKDKSFCDYISKKTKIYAEKTSWKNIAKQHYALFKSL